MRKFFYTIGVFLFLGLLIMGYCKTYWIADMREQMRVLENSREDQTADGSGNAELPAEDILPGEIVMADGSRENEGYGEYFLTVNGDFVIVYLSDRKTIFETTSIYVSSLPEKIQKEVRNGKYLKNQQELYSFLENYSS